MIQGLGERLLEKRLACKLTQAQVAQRIGVTPSAICFFEKGESVPSLISISRLARVYHCSIDYLITGKEFQPKKDDTFF